MRARKWNEDWKDWVERDSFALVWNVPEDAKTVTLPHDAMIEQPAHPNSLNGGDTGFRDGDIYTYCKNLYVSEVDRNKYMVLKFEGGYMNFQPFDPASLESAIQEIDNIIVD